MKPCTSTLLMLFCLLTIQAFSQQQKKPNIIFILADDLGYGDVQALNADGKIKTPALDQIANAGIRFTDAHSSSAVCTPSRYGILTGRYNWRSRLKSSVLTPYQKPLIDANRTTMASMLKQQGYRTACIGKWHLGFNWPTKDGKAPIDKKDSNNLDYSKPLTGGPTDAGFDYFFGVDAPNYPPYAFIQNNRVMNKPDHFLTFEQRNDCRPGTGLANWQLINIMPTLEQKTVTYIQKASKRKEPFFMYLPLTGPHTPIVPTDEYKGKSGLNIYADFVMQVDGYVGKILQALKENKILENTIVVFTSDNGCSPRAEFEVLASHGHNPSYIFRGMKADIFEGGHRIACLMQWPKAISANREAEQTISLIDFFATFAHITGYKLKDNEGEDSYDLFPLLKNTGYNKPIREAVVMHSINGSFSIRKGNWKPELCPGSGGWSYPQPGIDTVDVPAIQLYNLENDIKEERNVQSQHPAIVTELTALLKKYVNEGRSAPGLPQNNDGSFIPERMTWMANDR